MPAPPALTLLDWLLLGVLALSVVVGLWRGFLFECLSLAGWVVAWFGAQWSAPWLRAELPWSQLGLAADSGLASGTSFVIAFVIVLLAWSLLARLVRLLVHATPLSLPDRALGGVFGLLRGSVLLLALATVVSLAPASQTQPWRQSQGGRWLDAMLQVLKPMLPDGALRVLPA